MQVKRIDNANTILHCVILTICREYDIVSVLLTLCREPSTVCQTAAKRTTRLAGKRKGKPTVAIHATSVHDMYTKMQVKLADVVPDVEIQIKAEIAYEINRIKQEKNAVILGHNYMEPALFATIPDFVGDSLYLSRKAAETDKDIIVFCGVEFMAETAKILNPDKLVLLPAAKAGCSLAESITAEDVRRLKAQFPGVPVVTYINTYADVKAESDVCCTSGNAVAVVNSLEQRHRHLFARRISGEECGRRNRQAHHRAVAHEQYRVAGGWRLSDGRLAWAL